MTIRIPGTLSWRSLSLHGTISRLLSKRRQARIDFPRGSLEVSGWHGSAAGAAEVSVNGVVLGSGTLPAPLLAKRFALPPAL